MGNSCMPVPAAPATADGSPAAEEEDYAELGRQLLAKEPGRFDHLNPIYQHPDTGALLYVGGQVAASSRQHLSEHRISKIVFCQEPDEGRCHFEGVPGFEYLRFNIGRHRMNPISKTDPLEFFRPLYEFAERHLGEGSNVLVHCLAGAHRAGTAGVACLMYFCDLNVADATKAAKRRRPAINPIGGFPDLLARLEQARARARTSRAAAAAAAPAEDALEMEPQPVQ